MSDSMRNPIAIGPEFETLLGQAITREEFSRALGLAPPLQPGDAAEWMGMDARVGAGINALAACYDPTLDEEPFDAILAVYEPFKIGDQIDRRTLLVLELVAVADHPALLRVVGADGPAALLEMPLREALAEVRRILDPWPLERRPPFPSPSPPPWPAGRGPRGGASA